MRRSRRKAGIDADDLDAEVFIDIDGGWVGGRVGGRAGGCRSENKN